MTDVAHLLETMRAMREPPVPAPIAPYLAALLTGAIAAIVSLAVARRARQARTGLRRTAAACLAASRRLEPGERLAAQAHLLRRLVRTLRGDALAHGPDWLLVLDRTFATTFFSAGDGRIFADALYRRPVGIDVDALDRSLSRLIARGRLMPARA